MTDDLNALKSALNAATPAPDAARRAQNLARASQNFAALQGSRVPPRPKGITSLWTGAKSMLNTLTSRAGLTATTAIVACGFLFITPMGQTLLQHDPLAKTTEAAISETPVSAPESPAEFMADMANDIQTMDQAPMLQRTAPQDSTASGRMIAPAAPAITGYAGDQAGFGAAVELFTSAEPAIETYANADPNPLKITAEEPVSTFSIDVDTASYALIRSSIMAGHMPDPDAVRIEEMINYFPYDYPAPDGAHPFQPTVSVFETPWNPGTQLVHIGIQGAMPVVEDRPPLNLVFLIDTSGSMEDPAKLPLLRQSFRLMVDQLRPEDEVAIVTYAGSSTIALEPTPASDRRSILKALNTLTAGGSTNGQGGLEQAYALAESMAQEGDVSRVILATDGDFNVGLSDPRELESYIADQRDSGTYLSVLGFGRGNLQDATMQALAQNGNGTAAYIDTLSEAQKVLVDQLTGALFAIADDVKIQVEFNPATVAEYRLIGYETRALNREDFNNDAVDAGELGAGHTVTAIYEITPTDSPARLTDELRYSAAPPVSGSTELGFLRLRYKAPGDTVSQLIETPFAQVGTATTDAGFAAAMAGFGQLLRDGRYLGGWSYEDAIALANANRGDDPFGYRTQAVQLMRLAQSLDN